MDLAPADPRQILDAVVAVARPGAIDLGLSLCVRSMEQAQHAFLDRRRVESALLSLVRFCISHTPSPGSISVELEAAATGVRFRIEDSGPTLSGPEVAGLLALPTLRDDANHALRPLGLPLAAAVAQAHGGSLTVTSRPGRGLRFDLELALGDALVQGAPSCRLAPTAAERPVLDVVRGGADPDARLERPTVVVVEGEAHVNELIVKVLRRRYRVYSAPNGEVALPIIRKVRPDLVIADHAMPGMDGGALCRALRRDGALCDTPVLVLSACLPPDASRADRTRLSTMRKPFRPLELLERVDHILRAGGISRDAAGLPPRAVLDAAAEVLLQQGDSVALAFVGVGGLAQVEALHGRLERDRMATVVARRLQDNLRSDDLCAHVAEDVYGVLLTGIDARGARIVVTRLLRTLAETRVSTFEGTSAVVQVRLRGHAGVALGVAGTRATDLFARAERGLRVAEARGIGDLELAP